MFTVRNLDFLSSSGRVGPVLPFSSIATKFPCTRGFHDVGWVSYELMFTRSGINVYRLRVHSHRSR